MTDGHLGVEGVVELSLDEGRHLLHRAARDRLGMSGAAFLDAWDAGRLDHLDHCDVQEVAMLIPFAR